MTIKVTRWQPDTCDCVLEYSWDSESGEHHDELNTVIKRCIEHESVADPFGVVKEENTRKNKIHTKLVQDDDRIGETIIDENDTPQRKIKDSVEFNYKFSGKAPDREIEVEFKDKRTKATIHKQKSKKDGQDITN